MMKKIISIVFVISLCFVSFGCGNSANKNSSSKQDEFPVKETAIAYEEGLYTVGDQLPAGDYILVNIGEYEGWLTEYNDKSGTDSSRTNLVSFASFIYYRIMPDTYIELRSAVAYSVGTGATEVKGLADVVNILNDSGKYVAGMYWVGVDIEEGVYEFKPVDRDYGGRVYVYSDIPRGPDKGSSDKSYVSIESNDYPFTFSADVNNGQYISVRGATFERIENKFE